MPLSGTQTSRERASGNAEQHRRLGMQAEAEHSQRTAPSRAAAFWLVAGVLCLLFFAAGAPSPLYGIYRTQLRFSTTTLTAVFAIYAVVLLITLLVFGSVPDYLGRRRVILAAVMVSAGACAVFLAAHHVGLLFAARALQGLAVGTATGALGAALIDLQPEGSRLAPLITTAAPLLGVGAGALGSSVLVQYGPAPTRLVWWLLLCASVAAGAGILAIPELGIWRAAVWASLRPRVGVPRQARGTFATAVPCLVAVWALSGLYQSLGPSLAAQVTGSADLLWGGLMVFLLTGIAAAATVAFRGLTPRTAMLAGCLVLLVGVAVTFAAIATTTAATFLGGRGRRRRHRAGAPGRQPHPDRAGASRPARQAHRRNLHHLLPRAQHPGADRRGGNRTPRPAPHRPGLLHGDGRSRRSGSMRLDAPQARPRHRSTALARSAPRRDQAGRPSQWDGSVEGPPAAKRRSFTMRHLPRRWPHAIPPFSTS